MLHLDDLFEVMILSAEVGRAKPDRRTYQLACAAIGVAPERCAFVDDLVENIEGERALDIRGMPAELSVRSPAYGA